MKRNGLLIPKGLVSKNLQIGQLNSSHICVLKQAHVKYIMHKQTQLVILWSPLAHEKLVPFREKQWVPLVSFIENICCTLSTRMHIKTFILCKA